MINTLKQIIFMRTALWVNAFLYYLKRLPLAGKLVPDSVYANYSAKKYWLPAPSWFASLLTLQASRCIFCFLSCCQRSCCPEKYPYGKDRPFP